MRAVTFKYIRKNQYVKHCIKKYFCKYQDVQGYDWVVHFAFGSLEGLKQSNVKRGPLPKDRKSHTMGPDP